jgi:hypothetical protein
LPREQRRPAKPSPKALRPPAGPWPAGRPGPPEAAAGSYAGFSPWGAAARTALEVSAGVNFFNPSAGTAVFAKVDVTFGDDVDGIGGKAGMRVAW